MPYPQNYQTARDVENVVREQGAVPATIAILDGNVHIGLTDKDLKLLAQEGPKGNVRKCSRRDLSYVTAQKLHGATTVAGTLCIASMFEDIDVFVTGGIGGVHRNVTSTMDVSADLTELGRCPLMVVCAGAKSILDLPRTLEYLETEGVAVIGYGTEHFPAFFTTKTSDELKVPMRLNTPAECANWLDANKMLRMKSGAVLAVPNPQPVGDPEMIDAAVATALEEMEEQNVVGKDTTPFLLKRVNEITGGDSLESNIALVKHNAKVGSQIAVALANGTGAPPAGKKGGGQDDRPVQHQHTILVVGGATVDVVGTPGKDSAFRQRTSTPGAVQTTSGGVARNITEALARLSASTPAQIGDADANTNDIVFSSVIGDDGFGKTLCQDLEALGVNTDHVRVSKGQKTAVYQAILDETGDLNAAIAAMDIMKEIDGRQVDKLAMAYPNPSVIVMDGNLRASAMRQVCSHKAWMGGDRAAMVPVWFEPTSVEKAKAVFAPLVAGNTDKECLRVINRLTHISPNLDELTAMYDELRRIKGSDHANLYSAHERDDSFEEKARVIVEEMLAEYHEFNFNVEKNVVVTLGKEGVCLVAGRKERSRDYGKEHDQYAVRFFYLSPDDVAESMVNCTGAGDTLVGGTLHGLSMGKDTYESVKIGMKAASMSIESEAPVSPLIRYDSVYAR